MALKMETRPNGTLHVDLLFIKLLVEHMGEEEDEEAVPEVMVLHILDEATRFRLGQEVPSKSEASLRAGLWV